MNIPSFMFYFFEALAAGSAISLIFTRNVFYGALLLVVSLLAIAGIYVLAFAEFVAVTQILIYAGGILVVIIFGIMLTAKLSGKPLVVTNRNLFSGLLAGGTLSGILIALFSAQSFSPTPIAKPLYDNAMRETGVQLMTTYALPFEIAGLLLLVALMGATVIAASTKIKKG